MLRAIQEYVEQYSASDDGWIFSHHTNRWLKPAEHKDVFYFHVSLWKKGVGRSFYVHRLIAESFIPNPTQLPEVNHKDGNRQNNEVLNLEWVTSSENSFHAVQLGLRTYSHRLTPDEFEVCLEDVIHEESYQSLSERVPYKVLFLSVKLRRIARELGREDDLNRSLAAQRSTRARINGAQHQ